jgi:hypothetical protein
MTDKPTIGQLQRQIAKLQARLTECESQLDKQSTIIREHIYDVVDAQLKIKLALEILRGEA